MQRDRVPMAHGPSPLSYVWWAAPSPSCSSPPSVCWFVFAVSLQVQALSCASKFEAELKAEQDERKREEEKRRLRQAAFRELKAVFST